MCVFIFISQYLVFSSFSLSIRWESTNLTVAYDTPLEAIEMLRSKLQSYVQQNNREWSNVSVNIDKMEFQNAITLIVAMERTYTTRFLGFNYLTGYLTPTCVQIDQIGRIGEDAGHAERYSCATSKPYWRNWTFRILFLSSRFSYRRDLYQELPDPWTFPWKGIMARWSHLEMQDISVTTFTEYLDRQLGRRGACSDLPLS